MKRAALGRPNPGYLGAWRELGEIAYCGINVVMALLGAS
jgi:hypothetical protein